MVVEARSKGGGGLSFVIYRILLFLRAQTAPNELLVEFPWMVSESVFQSWDLCGSDLEESARSNGLLEIFNHCSQLIH